jgi:uncharacterized protein
MIKIPPESLSAEALRGLVEAFVLREGTDYGHEDYTLEQKFQAVLTAVRAGRAEIRFDVASGTADIRSAEIGPPARQRGA